MKTANSFGLAFALFSVLASAPVAQAQQAAPFTVRGTIERNESRVLTVKSREGDVVQIRLGDKTGLVGLSKIAIGDFAPNSFVGVAAIPQADGSLKALSVHLFPEALRGTNEGSRNYDVTANSSMTNGAIGETVTSNDGCVLTIKYRDGEKRVVVDPSTSLVRFEPGAAAAELQPGVKVIVNAAKLDNGTIEARRILIGRNGLAPAL